MSMRDDNDAASNRLGGRNVRMTGSGGAILNLNSIVEKASQLKQVRGSNEEGTCKFAEDARIVDRESAVSGALALCPDNTTLDVYRKGYKDDSELGGFKSRGTLEWLKSVPTSECAFNRQEEVGVDNICSPPIPISLFRTFLVDRNVKGALAMTKSEVVNAMMRIVNCNTESCIYRQESMKDVLGDNLNELRNMIFKVDGARTLDGPLYDSSIDGVMRQWAGVHKNFLPIGFQFKDFMLYPGTELRELNFRKHLLAGKRCFGVVINTDTTKSGHGKHWFSLFFDFRQLDVGKFVLGANEANETSLPCVVEYWNSSGNLPYSEIESYFNHLKLRFQREMPFLNMWYVSAACGKKQQYSPSECGAYSILYIWQRLNNTPMSYFIHNRIPDGDARLVRLMFHNFSSIGAVSIR